MTKIFSLAALLFLTGCFLKPITPPEVQLTDLQIKDVTVFETSIDATVRLENLSNEEISFESSVHKLYINGFELGAGRGIGSVRVPPLGTSEAKVRFNVGNLSFFNNIRKLVESQRFEYKLVSDFYRSSFGILGSTTVVKEGRLDLVDR